MRKPKRYTCADYRKEMILLGLRRRLNEKDLTAEERERLMSEIRELEAEMGMD
jgi:hypothetical protein